MGSVLVAVVSDLASFFRSRRALQLEILALESKSKGGRTIRYGRQ